MELRDLAAYGRYAVGLRRFLREQLTAEEGGAMVARGVERGRVLPRRAGTRGLPEPEQPVPPAAAPGGVEHGDVATSSSGRSRGGAGRLHDEGVRVTLSEFQAPSSFDNPLVGPGYPTSSSGTRNPPGG